MMMDGTCAATRVNARVDRTTLYRNAFTGNRMPQTFTSDSYLGANVRVVAELRIVTTRRIDWDARLAGDGRGCPIPTRAAGRYVIDTPSFAGVFSICSSFVGRIAGLHLVSATAGCPPLPGLRARVDADPTRSSRRPDSPDTPILP